MCRCPPTAAAAAAAPAAAAPPPTHTAPPPTPETCANPPALTPAQAGGTLEFVWTGFHGVWQVPSGSCPASFVEGPNMTEVG